MGIVHKEDINMSRVACLKILMSGSFPRGLVGSLGQGAAGEGGGAWWRERGAGERGDREKPKLFLLRSEWSQCPYIYGLEWTCISSKLKRESPYRFGLL
jgi:hypothetical protein